MDRKNIKKYLIEEKERLLDQLHAANTSLRDSVDELSLADNHPADLGSELFERSKELSVKETQTNLLNDIELALAKLETGRYGICERCGREITAERLEALPHAKLCIRCQGEEEKQLESGRPVEEEGLEPPCKNETVPRSSGRDAEDVWQEVGRYNERSGIFEDGFEDGEDERKR